MKSSVISGLVVLLLGSFVAAAPVGQCLTLELNFSESDDAGTVDIQLNDPEVLNARTTSESDIQISELLDPAVLNA